MKSEGTFMQLFRRRLPLRCRYWLAERELRHQYADLSDKVEREMHEALQEGDTSRVRAAKSKFGDLSQVNKELEDMRLRRFLGLADRWGVWVPEPPRDFELVQHERGETVYWTRADTVGQYSGWELTRQARLEIRNAIQQARKDRLQYWGTWITLLIGLIGTLIGLVSTLKKK